MKENLGSLSLEVASRILSVLLESGKIKKTNLAVKARLNYNACVRYLSILKRLKWIEYSYTDGWEYVSITEMGRQVREELLMQQSSSFPKRGKEEGEEEPYRLFIEEVTEPPSVYYQHAGGYLNRYDHLSLKKSGLDRINIMVVDDEPDVLFTYTSFLDAAGYNVTPFSESQEALAHFAATKPSYYNLVILDIRMPEVNGLQLYQRIRAIDPAVKIIFLSALDAARELTSLLPDVKPHEVIKKPIKKERFMETVEHLLAS